MDADKVSPGKTGTKKHFETRYWVALLRAVFAMGIGISFWGEGKNEVRK